MRVENPKLVVEPGAGRTGKLAMVAYQFQHVAFDKKSSIRDIISCCVLAYDFNTAVDTCQYWGAHCDGG